MLVFHDVSETRRLSRIRRDFAANVTHELRTPLTSIKGYAETLLGEKKFRDGQERRFLDSQSLYEMNRYKAMVQKILKSILRE